MRQMQARGYGCKPSNLSREEEQMMLEGVPVIPCGRVDMYQSMYPMVFLRGISDEHKPLHLKHFNTPRPKKMPTK